MKLNVAIPVYNEDAVIESTHCRISALLQAFVSQGLIDYYEMIGRIGKG